MKQITDIADARLVKGLAHPLRIDILRILTEGTASPTQIATRLQAPLGNVSYHVRFLARVGLIELLETRPRRGAVEHYYRAVKGVQVSDGAWAQVPATVRDTVLSTTLTEVGRAVGAAAAAGGFDHVQAQASRVEITLDCNGFSELSAAVSQLHERAADIAQQSARRIAAGAEAIGPEDGRGAIGAELVVMLFDSSPQDAEAPASA